MEEGQIDELEEEGEKEDASHPLKAVQQQSGLGPEMEEGEIEDEEMEDGHSGAVESSLKVLSIQHDSDTDDDIYV